MSSFKGDPTYTAYSDHSDDRSDDAEESMEVDFKVTQVDERRWFQDNYDALEHLYGVWKETGRQVFGDAFYQLGGFHHFVAFVYTHTIP